MSPVGFTRNRARGSATASASRPVIQRDRGVPGRNASQRPDAQNGPCPSRPSTISNAMPSASSRAEIRTSWASPSGGGGFHCSAENSARPVSAGLDTGPWSDTSAARPPWGIQIRACGVNRSSRGERSSVRRRRLRSSGASLPVSGRLPSIVTEPYGVFSATLQKRRAFFDDWSGMTRLSGGRPAVVTFVSVIVPLTCGSSALPVTWALAPMEPSSSGDGRKWRTRGRFRSPARSVAVRSISFPQRPSTWK